VRDCPVDRFIAHIPLKQNLQSSFSRPVPRSHA
jgi:hypothetical protein